MMFSVISLVLIMRLTFCRRPEKAKDSLADTKNQFETAQKEVQKPFVQEEELKLKLARLDG